MSSRTTCLDCGCEVFWHDDLNSPPFADHVTGGADCLRNQLATKDAELDLHFQAWHELRDNILQSPDHDSYVINYFLDLFDDIAPQIESEQKA